MEETWRWYGPNDPVTLADVRQSGATGIVTALHEIPMGVVWPVEDIMERKALIEASGLVWSVVESVPVHEAIKQGLPSRDEYIEAYAQTVRNLGVCGITRVCYNFMPVIDWTRTELEREWSDGSRALAFDFGDFTAFDLHILKRPGAQADYDEPTRARAAERFAAMSEERRAALARTVTMGLPGAMTKPLASLDGFQAALDAYAEISAPQLREHLAHFLRGVVPAAEEAGVYLALHPDDPPLPLLGMPRVVSTNADLEYLLGAVDSVHNGLCFCVGSFASSDVNDVEAMAEQHAARTNFVHLRNVRREGPKSFVESDHLDGEVDMFRVVRCMMRERGRRAAAGWKDTGIPFRPDHGHKMLSDLGEGKRTNPGYTTIGRLRGLAELRGIQEAIAKYEGQGATN